MIIIGDPGSTHGGTLEGCLEAVDVAKEAGIDILKFQLFLGNRNGNIELPRKHWKEIVEYARKAGIDIFASVFDDEAIDLLKSTGIKKAKLAYSQNFNLRLIKKLKEEGMEIWASGDMDSYPHYAQKRFYCKPEYPPKKMALGVVPQAWHGFSSHYLGYETEKGLMKDTGWQYLEKHFHISKKVDVPDYWFALSTTELKEMVQCLNKKPIKLARG